MSQARVLELARGGAGAWLGAMAIGALLGLGVAVAMRAGAWSPVGAALRELALTLNQRVGPVWIAMLAVAVRVGWLAVQAAGTRSGRGRTGRPVRPELAQLAPVFAALGLCGTVWGLSAAFDALDGGDFLARLPALLAGLGAAMTSTLVGLTLQIGTLLLAAFNPSWSRLDVQVAGDELGYCLDGIELGAGEPGRARVLEAVGSRAPEALRVCFARAVPSAERRGLMASLWERADSGVPIRDGDAGGAR